MQLGVEQAGRLVFNQMQGELTDTINQGEELEKHVAKLTKEHPNLANATAAAAILAGVVVAACFAYTATSKRLKKVHNEQEHYQDMIDTMVSTYLLKHAKREKHAWDHYLATYVKVLQEKQHPVFANLLWRYAGIHQKQVTDAEGRQDTVYTVIAMFNTPLAHYFPPTADDTDELTQARKALNFFIVGELKEVLSEVDSKVEPSMLNQVKLFANAEQILPRINATRLLLISLGNMALNVLFAMNPNTGMPLSNAHAADLCSLLRGVVDRMGSDISIDNDDFHQYRKKLCRAERLESFLTTFSGKIAALQEAYTNHAKESLNLNEVSNSSHLFLQQLNTSLRSLVYPQDQFSEPAYLIGKVIDLANLIYFHPDLVPKLVSKLHLPRSVDYQTMQVNNPPTTVIDVLMLWSHAEKNIRCKARSSMEKSAWGHFKGKDRQEFARILGDIEQHFILPIEKLMGNNNYEKTPLLNPAQLFLMSSIALLFRMHRLYLKEKIHIKSGNQQIRDINAQAISVDAQKLIALLKIERPTYDALTKVIKLQYENLYLLEAVNILELISQNNQRVGNAVSAQAFLQKSLRLLRDKQQALYHEVKDLIKKAKEEAKSDKHVLQILRALDDQNVKTGLSLKQIYAEFIKQVNHSIKMLKESTYDEKLELKEHAAIDHLEEIILQNPTWFDEKDTACCEELRRGLRSKQELIEVLNKPSLLSTTDGSATTSSPPETDGSATASLTPESVVTPLVRRDSGDSIEALAPISENKTTHYAFQWQAISIWLSRMSIALLLIGLFIVLLMAFGSQSIPVIAALSAPVATGIVISGLVSAAMGGFGLATSYYAPRLFKPKPPQKADEVLNGSNLGHNVLA